MNNGMGTVPAGSLPTNAASPINGAGQPYPAGSVPGRAVDGALRPDQSVIGSGNPATVGQPARRTNRGRTTTTPVRP